MDRSFEGLRVWQQSRTFVNDIYDIMEEVKDYGFSGSDAKFVNFLQISRGSCSEVRSMLYLCVDRHMIDQETFEHLKAEAVSISNQLYRLIESIAKGPKKP